MFAPGRGTLAALWDGPKGLHSGQKPFRAKCDFARRETLVHSAAGREAGGPGSRPSTRPSCLGLITRISTSCIFHRQPSGHHWSSTAECRPPARANDHVPPYEPSTLAFWLLCRPQFRRVCLRGRGPLSESGQHFSLLNRPGVWTTGRCRRERHPRRTPAWAPCRAGLVCRPPTLHDHHQSL